MKPSWKESWQIVTKKERSRREKIVGLVLILGFIIVFVVVACLGSSGYIVMVPREYGRPEFYGILCTIPFIIAFLLRRFLVGLYGERIIFDAIPIVIAAVSVTICLCYLFDLTI